MNPPHPRRPSSDTGRRAVRPALDPLRTDDRGVLVGYLHRHSRMPETTTDQMFLAMAEYALRHGFELVVVVAADETEEVLGVADLLRALRSTRVDAVLLAGPANQAMSMLDKFRPTLPALTLADIPPPPPFHATD